MKKKNYDSVIDSISLYWRKVIAEGFKRRRIFVLAFAILVAALISGLTASELQAKSRYDSLASAIEILFKNKLFGIAEKAASLLLDYDRGNARTRLLVSNLARVFEDRGTKEISNYNIVSALELFRKAERLAPSDALLATVVDIEYTLSVPKLFIEGVPFNASLTKNGESWERSFCRIPLPPGEEPHKNLLPGNVLRFRMTTQDEVESLLLCLSNENGKVLSSNRGFAIARHDGQPAWFCLLGLPPTLSPGEYTLEGNWTLKSGGAIGFAEKVAIRRRLFAEETIALNAKLTGLLTVPDRKKQEERILVSEVLGSFHPESVFQEDRFTLPSAGCMERISSLYGERRVFKYATGGGYTSVHDGIDFGLVTGTPVLAVGRGKVSLARKHIVSGNTIIIEHIPGVFSVYYHLSKIDTSEGAMVSQGEKIGEVGSTGLSTAAHLHLSVFAGEVAVDPEFFIKNKPLF